MIRQRGHHGKAPVAAGLHAGIAKRGKAEGEKAVQDDVYAGAVVIVVVLGDSRIALSPPLPSPPAWPLLRFPHPRIPRPPTRRAAAPTPPPRTPNRCATAKALFEPFVESKINKAYVSRNKRTRTPVPEWLRSNFVWRAPNPTLLAHATTRRTFSGRLSGCAGCQSWKTSLSGYTSAYRLVFVPLPVLHALSCIS